MKMKTLRSLILCLVVLLLTAPLLRAQDLSKYRHFTLGMNLTNLLERTEQKMTDVKTTTGMTRSKSLSRLGKMRNIPPVLCVLPSMTF
jgi:hypothetical protein